MIHPDFKYVIGKLVEVSPGSGRQISSQMGNSQFAKFWADPFWNKILSPCLAFYKKFHLTVKCCNVSVSLFISFSDSQRNFVNFSNSWPPDELICFFPRNLNVWILDFEYMWLQHCCTSRVKTKMTKRDWKTTTMSESQKFFWKIFATSKLPFSVAFCKGVRTAAWKMAWMHTDF